MCINLWINSKHAMHRLLFGHKHAKYYEHVEEAGGKKVPFGKLENQSCVSDIFLAQHNAVSGFSNVRGKF